MVTSKALVAPPDSAVPELSHYVAAVESENRKLHRQIAKLEAQVLTKHHRISALENEMKDLTKKHGVTFNMNIGSSEKDG